MYMLYNKDRYTLIDREREGKKVATAIVRALLQEPPTGMWSRLKDKWDELTDPDDPHRYA